MKMKDNNFKTENIWQLPPWAWDQPSVSASGACWRQMPCEWCQAGTTWGDGTLRSARRLHRGLFTKDPRLEFNGKSHSHHKTAMKIAGKSTSKVSTSWKSKSACVTCHSLEKTKEMLMLDQKKDISVTSLAIWVRSVVLCLVLMTVLWWYSIFTLGYTGTVYCSAIFWKSEIISE